METQSGHNPWPCDRECNSRFHFSFFPYEEETITAADELETEKASTVFGHCYVDGLCGVVTSPVVFKSRKGTLGKVYILGKHQKRGFFFHALQSSCIYLCYCEET